MQDTNAPFPQACHFLLTNLKTHLRIKISKGLAIDGKRETKGRAYEIWPSACLTTGIRWGVANRCVPREADCEKWIVDKITGSKYVFPSMAIRGDIRTVCLQVFHVPCSLFTITTFKHIYLIIKLKVNFTCFLLYLALNELYTNDNYQGTWTP